MSAVASRHGQSAAQFGETHGIQRCHGSYADLAADPGVDAVYVGTIHPVHAEAATLCLDAGKHVLCEKPLAMNLRQATDMVSAAQSAGVLLAEAMWTRYFPVTRRVRELIASGTIGEVCYATADFGVAMDGDLQRIWDPEKGGGGLLDVGIYPLAWLSMVCGGGRGAAPDQISAAGSLSPRGVDRTVGAVLRWGDVVGTMSCSIECSTPKTAMVVGTKGRITVQAPFWCPESMVVELEEGDSTKVDSAVAGPRVDTFDSPVPATPDWAPVPWNFVNSAGFAYEAAAVTDAILAGRTEVDEMPLAESLALAAAMDAIRRNVGVSYAADA